MIRTQRRRRGLVVLAVATVVTFAGCQSASDGVRSAAVPSTSAAGRFGNPWPPIGPAPPEHHAILTMGDSLMGGTYATLPGVLAAHGFDATVYDGHVNASGLLDPMNGLSAREYLALQLEAHPDVDTVIFEWAGVCDDVCGTESLAYGSTAFFNAWQADTRDLILDARSRGLKVVWAVSPPPPPDASGAPLSEAWSNQEMRVLVTTVGAAYERNYAAEFGVAVADWWEALSDTNSRWQQTLFYDGTMHEVRSQDRVHLTEDGSIRASTWTAAALASLYGR